MNIQTIKPINNPSLDAAIIKRMRLSDAWDDVIKCAGLKNVTYLEEAISRVKLLELT